MDLLGSKQSWLRHLETFHLSSFRLWLISVPFWAVRLSRRAHLFPEWLIRQAHGWNEAAERGGPCFSKLPGRAIWHCRMCLLHFHTAALVWQYLQTLQAAFITVSKESKPYRTPMGVMKRRLSDGAYLQVQQPNPTARGNEFSKRFEYPGVSNLLETFSEVVVDLFQVLCCVIINVEYHVAKVSSHSKKAVWVHFYTSSALVSSNSP